MSGSAASTTQENSLEELSARRKARRGAREKGTSAGARERANNRSARARASAPEGGGGGGSGGLRDGGSLNARSSRFGREERLKRSAPGEKTDDDDDDGSSGSDTDSGDETQRLVNGGGQGAGATNSKATSSMVTPPVSMKFWKVAGDLSEDSGGQLIYPSASSRVSRAEKKKRGEAKGKRDANGPGSGFSVDKAPTLASGPKSDTFTVGRMQRRLNLELATRNIPASVSGSKNNKSEQKQDPQAIKDKLNADWFSSSGHIKTLPDPIDTSRVMPAALSVSGGAVDVVKPEEFRTTHNQGHMGSQSANIGNKGRRAQVVIKFGRIRFSDHASFTSEDRIAHRLLNLHSEYWKMIESDVEAHHLSRVLACGSVLSEKKDEVVQYSLMEQKQGTELMNLAMDMYQSWSEYIGIFRTVRGLEKKVYETWRELKEHRVNQNMSVTSLHLEVRKMASVISTEKGWTKVIQTMRLLEDVLELLEPKLLETSAGKNGEKNSYFMRNRAAAEFKVFEHSDLSLKIGETAVPILLLSEKHAITPTGELDPRLQSYEIKRRAQVGACQYYGRLVINGYPVGKTRVAGLRWPEFELDFQSTMRVEVVRRPDDVLFEIYKKGTIKDTYVNSIPIALSGPNDMRTSATTTAPVFAMYSFSAIKADIPFSGQISLAGEQKEDDDNDASNFFLAKEGRYTSGRLEITTTWLGWLSEKAELDGADLWAPLPPETRDSERAKLIGGPVDSTGALAVKNGLADDKAGVHLISVVGKARLDPNDPSNTQVMQFLRNRTAGSIDALEGSEPYRVGSIAGNNEGTFKSKDSTKFRVPERQHLLQLRYAMPHLFMNGKPLPLLDSEILQDPHWRVMLAPKNRAKLMGGKETEKEEEDPDYFGFDSEFLIKRQNKMKSFVERVRRAQLELRGSKKSRGMVSRWVREGILPEFQLDLSFVMNKLAPKRKLKPKISARKEAPMVKDVYLIVQVSSAFNVPMRRQALQNAASSASTGQPGSPVRGRRGLRGGSRQPSPERRAGGGGGDDVEGGTPADQDMDAYAEHSDDDEDVAGNLRMCNTFVEGSFQGQHPRTSARGGSQPVWNETLRMRFVPAYTGTSSRWTTASMNQVRDKVRISVFDEQTHQNEKDFRQRNSVNERRERRYLGSISVPFTTIYRQKTVRGLFRLERPEVNLAYETPISAEDDGNPDNVIIPGSERALKIASAEATYVNLMLTLDPPLTNLGDDANADEGGVVSSEKQKVLKRAAVFQKLEDKKRGPIKVIVPTLNGEKMLVTRFITPQQPPPEITTITEAARFVSLIPFMEDWQLFAGNEDMWAFSNQFLELCAGDWEEHAVLLRNYFAFLDGNRFENYIVFGHGLPEGDTVYVLRRPSGEEDSDITLWNASTGIEYARSDTRCALQSVSCVVSEDNIYINLQQQSRPINVKFDLQNKKNWRPFFDAKFPLPDDYSPSQPEILYIPTPTKDLEGLERQIMETLRSDLKEWRSKHYQTYLNTTVSRDLQKTLESLEGYKMGRDGYSEYDHLDALKKWTATYDFSGFPLNFTFTDVKAISYAIKDTNIHMNEDPNVKFAITVKCFGYSNGVISVWVYAAALVRK